MSKQGEMAPVKAPADMVKMYEGKHAAARTEMAEARIALDLAEMAVSTAQGQREQMAGGYNEAVIRHRVISELLDELQGG